MNNINSFRRENDQYAYIAEDYNTASDMLYNETRQNRSNPQSLGISQLLNNNLSYIEESSSSDFTPRERPKFTKHRWSLAQWKPPPMRSRSIDMYERKRYVNETLRLYIS